MRFWLKARDAPFSPETLHCLNSRTLKILKTRLLRWRIAGPRRSPCEFCLGARQFWWFWRGSCLALGGDLRVSSFGFSGSGFGVAGFGVRFRDCGSRLMVSGLRIGRAGVCEFRGGLPISCATSLNRPETLDKMRAGFEVSPHAALGASFETSAFADNNYIVFWHHPTAHNPPPNATGTKVLQQRLPKRRKKCRQDPCLEVCSAYR